MLTKKPSSSCFIELVYKNNKNHHLETSQPAKVCKINIILYTKHSKKACEKKEK